MPIFVITTPALPAQPSSYTLTAVAPTCNTPKNHLCYIVAADNGNSQPVIDNPLLEQIATALNSNTESLNVKLKA